ncbi:hypothetical protein FQ154_16870 [Paeniglutamicibacter gangotriensis]|uniref:Uncharacterized protein n=1 Tax=Paeniglutamicibacter gangotriensis TaxID=254787 RepID=A0A5B0E667_9MICC|nr:hypothetical protein [Paeniglutamicibacter gangotriensis]KAA0974106.1 hypothetical protein FQ154_16870 [Paeniglutamicibacter gangotriensis]
MGDDGYEEVQATIRIPKGKRLADSHDTEGWMRGFTAKTSESGPQHVEIKINDPAVEAPHDEYGGYGSDESYEPARAKTDEDQEYEEFVRRLVVFAILGAIVVGKPFLRRLLEEKIIPFYQKQKTTWETFKARRTKIQPQPLFELGATRSLGAAVAVQEASMTSDEARQHFAEALMAQHFANEKMRLLASARIEDTDLSPKALNDIKKLTQGEVEQTLMLLMANHPNLLTDIASGRQGALSLESLSAIPKKATETRSPLDR